jgi:sporulation protein YlmC with PRC-barrel domain
LSIVHLERLSGKKILDMDGKTAGRLEEVHADWRGGECIVTHYVIATARKRRPLTLAHLIAFVLREMGAHTYQGNVDVPWDKLDLSDPEHPRLQCRAAELT